MKTKTLSLTTILGFLGLILMIHTFSAGAAIQTGIVCSTAFGEKSFTIDDQKISFHKEDEDGMDHSGNRRSIASIQGPSVRTQKQDQGFTKTLYIGGNKHRIHVKNVNQFSDTTDYLSIMSPKGHEMTYPLNCHSV